MRKAKKGGEQCLFTLSAWSESHLAAGQKYVMWKAPFAGVPCRR